MIEYGDAHLPCDLLCSFHTCFYRGDLLHHELILAYIPSPRVTFCDTLLPRRNAQRHRVVAQSPFQTQAW